MTLNAVAKSVCCAAWERQRQVGRNPELRDPRAILLLAYQHTEPPMRLPRAVTSKPSPLMVAMRAAIKAGLEIWQVLSWPWSAQPFCSPRNVCNPGREQTLTCAYGFGTCQDDCLLP